MKIKILLAFLFCGMFFLNGCKRKDPVIDSGSSKKTRVSVQGFRPEKATVIEEPTARLEREVRDVKKEEVLIKEEVRRVEESEVRLREREDRIIEEEREIAMRKRSDSVVSDDRDRTFVFGASTDSTDLASSSDSEALDGLLSGAAQALIESVLVVFGIVTPEDTGQAIVDLVEGLDGIESVSKSSNVVHKMVNRDFNREVLVEKSCDCCFEYLRSLMTIQTELLAQYKTLRDKPKDLNKKSLNKFKKLSEFVESLAKDIKDRKPSVFDRLSFSGLE